jgi:putative NADPH-quinone reductase/1,4-dihydroxy-2-naphthoate octaprenyltransferase
MADAARAMSMQKVLVVIGHPRSPSLCGALAAAYADGARAAGMVVEVLNLASLRFDPDVHTMSPVDQPLEPDLAHARQLIQWADHLCLVFPAWWGVGPARLHGFLDRVLLPGFAFGEHDGRFEGLLRGRTAHLLCTMDMPPWVYRLIYRAPGYGAMKRSILGFCGIACRRTLSFGPVKDSDAALRAAWLAQAHAMGGSLRDGAAGRLGSAADRLLAWVKALRLQFYPMSWMGYTIGALGALGADGGLDGGRYWLGYLFLFFLEAATVFANDWFDFESDRRNRHHGPFNGGSRMLVQGDISFDQMAGGIAFALGAALVCAAMLLPAPHAGMSLSAPGAALLAMMVLALGYTVPPLKLSWRGLGEIDVGITHSFGVLLVGYLLQGGAWRDGFPWLVSLPLCLSILPSILLSGFPDMEADLAAGKRTLASRLGHRGTLLAAMAPTLLAAATVAWIRDMPAVRGCLDGLLPWALAHACLLSWLLWRARQRQPGRIDGLLIAALGYILWYAAFPLWHLA